MQRYLITIELQKEKKLFFRLLRLLRISRLLRIFRILRLFRILRKNPSPPIPPNSTSSASEKIRVLRIFRILRILRVSTTSRLDCVNTSSIPRLLSTPIMNPTGLPSKPMPTYGTYTTRWSYRSCRFLGRWKRQACGSM